MLKFCLFGLALGFCCGAIQSAEPPPALPLATTSVPPCSKHPGVRTSRSELIQFKDVNVSISSQSAREGASCVQSAALWVTQKDVSQQFEIPDSKASDSKASIFSIVDISPDATLILLSSRTSAGRKDSTAMAIVALADGAIRWSPLAQLLGVANCQALEPLGFNDSQHILIAADCPGGSAYYSLDVKTAQAKPAISATIRRSAKVAGPPVQTFKSDPYIIGACRTTRARLAFLSPDSDGLLLWPVGSAHFMAVPDGMLPAGLREELSPDMRIYATMVICPIAADNAARRPSMCVDSATDTYPDPASSKVAHAAGSRVSHQ